MGSNFMLQIFLETLYILYNCLNLADISCWSWGWQERDPGGLLPDVWACAVEPGAGRDEDEGGQTPRVAAQQAVGGHEGLPQGSDHQQQTIESILSSHHCVFINRYSTLLIKEQRAIYLTRLKAIVCCSLKIVFLRFTGFGSALLPIPIKRNRKSKVNRQHQAWEWESDKIMKILINNSKMCI